MADSLFAPDARLRRRLLSLGAPVARPMLRMDYTINDDTARASEAQIRAAMDRLETEIGPGGYLAGDAFSVADLTAAALFTPLLAPPERQYQPPRCRARGRGAARRARGAAGRGVGARDVRAPPRTVRGGHGVASLRPRHQACVRAV